MWPSKTYYLTTFPMKHPQLLIVESQPLTAFGIQSATPTPSVRIFPGLRQLDAFWGSANPDHDVVQVVIVGPSTPIDAGQVWAIKTNISGHTSSLPRKK